ETERRNRLIARAPHRRLEPDVRFVVPAAAATRQPLGLGEGSQEAGLARESAIERREKLCGAHALTTASGVMRSDHEPAAVDQIEAVEAAHVEGRPQQLMQRVHL